MGLPSPYERAACFTAVQREIQIIFTFMYTLKKSLGQHFLKDENISRKIVSALQQHPVSQLLEVGPGGGALTKHLLQINDIDFLAVEVDD